LKIFFVIDSKQLAAPQSFSGDMWNQTVISYLIPLIWVMCQGSIAELTVLLKLNQGVPEIGRNRFRAAFCATFFRKKVAEKQRGIFREKEDCVYGNKSIFCCAAACILLPKVRPGRMWKYGDVGMICST
jgi:hypothetical protein